MQVEGLERLLRFTQLQSGGDSGVPGDFFRFPRFEEIFDGHFRRGPARFQGQSKTTVAFFSVTRCLVR